MTVCVAAITADSAVLLASDRMLTAGDVQFQPTQSKIYTLTTSIVAMLSGDVALASELLRSVKQVVDARIAAEPKNWWLVQHVVELWRTEYLRVLNREAETAFLSPLGLTSESFISEQKKMSPSLAQKMATEILNYKLPAMDLIFAGIDPTGPHIYIAFGPVIKCADAIGFAAVGSGAYHARSQMMFAGHTASAPLNRSVFLTYSAKRRAEVAPGVGTVTDTYIISSLGKTSVIRDDVMQCIKDAYERAEAESTRIATETENQVDEQIQALLNPPKQPNQDVPQVVDGTTPASA